MAKYLKVVVSCFLIAGPSNFAHAQAFYRDVTFKESLVQVLYQYGKEAFYRGIDPQGASYVFQRVLVLNCSHQGAQAFLNKIHYKHPDVSIKVWGCEKAEADADLPDAKNKMSVVVSAGHASRFAEVSSEGEVTDDPASEEQPAGKSEDPAEDNDKLKQSYQNLQEEISHLENKAKEKDSVIAEYQQQLGSGKGDEDASYETIAQDQKDLIRIQQSNIDFLKSELAEAKKSRASATALNDDEKYGTMRREIAGSDLAAQEKQMDLLAKDVETRTLKAQLEDLEEQLRLVQEIVHQKNALIQSLETEVMAIKPVDK